MLSLILAQILNLQLRICMYNSTVSVWYYKSSSMFVFAYKQKSKLELKLYIINSYFYINVSFSSTPSI